MKTHLFCIAMLIMSTASFAQKNTSATEAVITYGSRSNGKETGGEKKLFIKGAQARIAGQDRQAKQEQFLQFEEAVTYQVLNSNGNLYTFKKPFSEYATAELIAGTDTIMGIPCKKAKVFIRSNTIEIWYTNDLKIKGTPDLTITPGIGLILKTIRNGNTETYAKKIDYRKVKAEELAWPKQWGTILDEAAYQRQVIESRYQTINIFNKEKISFGNKTENPAADQSNATYHFSGGTVILKKVKLPAARPGQSVFAELIQNSNGDAYDRTGSVFMIPVDKSISFLNALQNGLQTLPVYLARNGKKYQGVTATDNYLPPLELMRFFTSFGVKHFNEQAKIKGYNWADSVIYKQDITVLSPKLQGEVWIGVYIGNYDKGGHTVSLNLNYYPGYEGEKEKEKKSFIMPVFNTTNLMEMAGQEYGTMFEKDSLTVTIDVPQGVKNLRLRYLTTGHGGWGKGDEFVPKMNEIFVDGKRVYHFIPWREDCATYRFSNPSSGNFGNGLSSSDLSRSNWCPGTLTLPVEIPLENLTPGQHTLQVAIPLGKPEGTSFSSWNVSGVLIGDQE
ncbi:peptide-N-glycosidase F-related protein [Pedobacter sp. PLR]|uniref:PNGase F N-terminal domain-containing protein n=1 Tax=Pedobacter sp. PLR TaxID=2994465 RepID=UPI002247E2B3|nr:PNGase F N-terminal domain-containing protein [Pedobacter sp. PLR]MCX2451518.1 peptide-N-glycosidase F-related protein [Pedobacter sp. PLR]